MRVAVCVHVSQTVHELFHEVTRLGLSEATTQGNQIEKLTTTDVLKNEIIYKLATFCRMYLLSTADLV